MTAIKRVLCMMLLVIVAIATASAQTSNGSIVGSVNDPTGAAVVGATVTSTSLDNGATRSTVTSSQGTYRIDSILPGNYKVSASAPGFEESVLNGLVVPASAITSASLVLKIGAASDKVEVVADNALVDVDNGQLSGTIGTLEISNLPIASLSPYELALTLPGVTALSQGGLENGVAFTVGGGRPRANNFLIEGQDNNDAGIAGQGLQPENDEAVKEVVIIENAYTAEFGHGAGSVSNLIYKSGSNQFHGSIFERAQNSSLDTVDKQDHFNGSTPTKYRENMPGFSLGGPIKRNKAFFFASYQWDYYNSTANLNVLDIPTATGLATLKAVTPNTRLTNLLTAFGPLVGTINPNNVVTPIALGPDPSSLADRGTVEMGTVQRSAGLDTLSPELDLKGDYVFSEKDTLNLRFIHTSYLAPFDFFNAPGQLPGFDSDQNGISDNAGIVETHVFSPKLLNEFRLSYGRIGFTFGLPSSTTSNPLYNQPSVSVTGIQGYGIPGNIPQGRFHNTYQLQDSVSWAKGKHFLKIGADIEDVRVRDEVPWNYYGAIGYVTDVNPSTVGEASVTYTGLANLIDDFGGPNSTVSQNFGAPLARPQLVSQNYFVQDTWRPQPDLSIDMGFRYEYNGAPFNAPGTPYPGVDLNDIACFPSAGVTCNLKQQADGSQWGPRAGLSYNPQIFGQHKSVIRAGFGVFYDVVFTNIIDNIQATAPNAASPVITSNATHNPRGTANWTEQFANLNHSPFPGNTDEPIADHLLSPRTMHWNLGIQQELPWATSLQVNYVGERGEHLYANEEINPYVNDFFYASRVNPTRGNMVIRDNSGDSNYTGLWAELDHQFNHAFLLRASYTLGRAMDDSSEIFTFNNQSSYPSSRYGINRGTTDYGLSAYDHRQRLVVSYIWQPAVWHTEGSMRVLGNIINRWSIAGISQFQSGSPENVEVGYDVNGDGISNDRPQVSNPKAPMTTYAFDDSWYYGVSTGTLCSGPSYWYTNNPCEVVAPSAVHWVVSPYGQEVSHPVSRNSIVSPGYQQWDMNIQRSFKLYENVILDFRGEMFNIFNHGEPGIANTSLISGIPTDAFTGPNGTNTFDDYAPTVSGHRHARLFVRIRF